MNDVKPLLLVCTLPMAFVMPGCSSLRPNQEVISVADVSRDRPGAIKSNLNAVDAINKDELDEAEQLLTEAVRLDITYAPAHNNLGALYLLTDRYYLAAWEFEYAAKLVPGDPRPRNNLGLVMETIGRLDSAIEHYEGAVDIEPDNPEYNGNLARSLSKSGEHDRRLKVLLEHLVLIDPRENWREWAGRELLRLKSADAD